MRQFLTGSCRTWPICNLGQVRQRWREWSSAEIRRDEAGCCISLHTTSHTASINFDPLALIRPCAGHTATVLIQIGTALRIMHCADDFAAVQLLVFTSTRSEDVRQVAHATAPFAAIHPHHCCNPPLSFKFAICPSKVSDIVRRSCPG